MDFSWALEYPDLHQICNLFQLYEILNPIRFKYKPIIGIVQEGPQCGLVALAMLTDNVTRETVNAIMNEAKNRGYTYNGEMFSAHDMCDLARCTLSNEIELYEGSLNSNYIIEILFNGGCLLVPYDSDKNHAPSLQRGYKAHWAVISGIIETTDNVYVLAKHGKSKRVNIWDLHELALSNEQLFEFSSDRKLSDVEYKLPEDGIAGSRGLNRKAVLIK